MASLEPRQDTQPSYSQEAETAVLGSLINYPELCTEAVQASLDGSEFFFGAHRHIWRAITSIAGRGGQPDLLTVTEELRQQGRVEEAGGLPYVAEVAGYGLGQRYEKSLHQHIDIVVQAALRRRVEAWARGLATDVLDPARTPAETIQAAIESLEALETRTRGGVVLPFLTAEELFSMPVEDPEWAVHRVLLADRQGVVYSEPGLGKSMLSRHLALAVATGGKALDRYPAKRGRVIWVTAEETVDDLRRGLTIAAEGNGFDLELALENMWFAPLREEAFALSDVSCRGWLERRIEELRPVLVVMDTLANLSGVDLSDQVAITPILRWGSMVSSRLHTCIQWDAHTKKDREASDIDSLFGSRQNSALVDFAFRLKRSKNRDVILCCTKMRGAAQPDDVTIEVVTVSDREFGMRALSSERVPALRDTPDTQPAIQRFLEQNPGSSLKRVRDTVGNELSVRPADVGDVIKYLMRQGFIENHGTDRRFELHWNSSPKTPACPGVSEHVPDTGGADRVSVSPVAPPPYGGGVGTHTRAQSCPPEKNEFDQDRQTDENDPQEPLPF